MGEPDEARTANGETSPSGPGAPDGEVAELRAQVADLDDRWRRALADFDNLRKRMVRECAQQRDDERARVATQWLPVLDNLERAVQHSGSDPETVLSGVRAVLDQARGVLADLGFPRRADLNQPFDPARHEAVAVVPARDAAPGTILEVVRPGYGNDQRLLRPAAVVVAKDA